MSFSSFKVILEHFWNLSNLCQNLYFRFRLGCSEKWNTLKVRLHWENFFLENTAEPLSNLIENMDKNISDKTELESVIKFYSILCTEQQKHREEKKNTQTYHDKKREHDLRICFKRKMNARGEIFYHIMDRKAYRNCGV